MYVRCVYVYTRQKRSEKGGKRSQSTRSIQRMRTIITLSLSSCLVNKKEYPPRSIESEARDENKKNQKQKMRSGMKFVSKHRVGVVREIIAIVVV